jgi:hypothetical protein
MTQFVILNALPSVIKIKYAEAAIANAPIAMAAISIVFDLSAVDIIKWFCGD